jgi:hypothetical protein
MQTVMMAASRLVDTASREPLGMSLTWLTSSSPRPGPTTRSSTSPQSCCGAFQSRRHDPRGDQPGFEQSQVVLGEIEHLGQRSHVGPGPQVHAGQPQHRLGRSRAGRPRSAARLRVPAADAQIHRDVQHPRAFGKVHAQEENVAPGAVRQIHAHRRPLPQDGNRSRGDGRGAVRVGRAADGRWGGRCGTSTGCRAPSGRCAAPGRPASGNPVDDRRRPARWRSCRYRPATAMLQKHAQRLVEPPLQQVLKAAPTESGAAARRQLRRQMIPVDVAQQEQRPHPLVQIVGQSRRNWSSSGANASHNCPALNAQNCSKGRLRTAHRDW